MDMMVCNCHESTVILFNEDIRCPLCSYDEMYRQILKEAKGLGMERSCRLLSTINQALLQVGRDDVIDLVERMSDCNSVYWIFVSLLNDYLEEDVAKLLNHAKTVGLGHVDEAIDQYTGKPTLRESELENKITSLKNDIYRWSEDLQRLRGEMEEASKGN